MVDKDALAKYMYESFMVDVKEVQRLLSEGADVNAVNKHGQNSLIMASQNGKIEIINFLIKKCKVNVDSTDNYGKTALMYACHNNKTATVKVVKKYQADIDIKNNEGQTALDIAKEELKKYRGTIIEPKTIEIVKNIEDFDRNKLNKELPIFTIDDVLVI